VTFTRRDFLATSAASLAFAAFRDAARANGPINEARAALQAGGPASVPRPLTRGPLALPPGFRQTVLSRTGEAMDDGLLVPGKHDGMAAFAVDGNANATTTSGKVLLVRNHEIDPAMGVALGPFGPKLERLSQIKPEAIYDAGAKGVPCLAGTTTLLVDLATMRVEHQHLSLVGTSVNCAGGRTPWGSWITCEECTYRPDGKIFAKEHGYCFEVPAKADGGLVTPVPLTALGRFKHEAVAVDPTGSIVYLTEDVGDGSLYRLLMKTPGRLTDGGRLQALVAVERPSLDSRNWPDLDAKGVAKGPPIIRVRQGDRFAVRWVDIDEVEAPKDDLRHRTFAKGAMRFARCEGIWHTGDAIYIAATTGGPNALGQLWRYVPSPHEGSDAESSAPASIELFVESHDASTLKNCDNLCASPWGELFVCEDGTGRDGIVRVKPNGEIHRFALNVTNDSELAGVCFSPDGSTLFVNVQDPGMTVAIQGPWER
jgi:secreted PhoX family phosphatase